MKRTSLWLLLAIPVGAIVSAIIDLHFMGLTKHEAGVAMVGYVNGSLFMWLVCRFSDK